MNNLWPVYTRETKSYFFTPIGFLVIAIFLILSGILFSLVINEYSRLSFEVMRSNQTFKMEGLTVAEGIIRPIFSSTGFLMLLMMPLITMKSFSEEKKTGTIEILFTYPIRDFDLVFGKYLAAVTVFAVMLIFTLAYILVVQYFKEVPVGETLVGYLGLLLMGSAFLSLGIFISSLTENQIIAAAWSFGMIMAFWLIGWLAGDSRDAVAEIIRYLSIFKHFESFASGIIDTRDIVYYLSFSGFFIFATLRVLESKRWRS